MYGRDGRGGEGGGITRINGTNAVHLEAIDHGTVQPSTQMYQYFPEQPIDLYHQGAVS